MSIARATAAHPLLGVALMALGVGILPVMDGLEATRRLRQLSSPVRRIPILALTANALAEAVERCLEAGMDAHCSKPIQREDLLAKISRLLDQARPDNTRDCA